MIDMLVQNSELKQEYYSALINRDSQYIGIFYVGVLTTSIFCISTCRARKPKFANIEFYTSIKDVLDHGFRPCKICKPTEKTNELPDYAQKAIQLIHENPKEKFKDYHLRNHDISPEKLRRWFKQYYGLTFHAYQRMFCINNAFNELQSGNTPAETAYNNDYESLSGFNYAFKKITKKSPSLIEANNIILINRLTTPLGPMFICSTQHGICLLEFTDRKMLESEFDDIQKRKKGQILFGVNKHIQQAITEIEEYFNGSRMNFEVELDCLGTDFQQLVWNSLRKIPYGTSTYYEKIAENLNIPNATRAIASANGYNKISIMIPCHRVVAKNGNLTGYGGGLERKKWLINHEKNNLS